VRGCVYLDHVGVGIAGRGREGRRGTVTVRRGVGGEGVLVGCGGGRGVGALGVAAQVRGELGWGDTAVP